MVWISLAKETWKLWIECIFEVEGPDKEVGLREPGKRCIASGNRFDLVWSVFNGTFSIHSCVCRAGGNTEQHKPNERKNTQFLRRGFCGDIISPHKGIIRGVFLANHKISQQCTIATHRSSATPGSALGVFHPWLWPLNSPGYLEWRVAKPLISLLTPVPPAKSGLHLHCKKKSCRGHNHKISKHDTRHGCGLRTWVECRRRQSWRCSESTRQSSCCSCSEPAASARPPRASTPGRGRWRRRSDSVRGAGRRQPSCSWRRTSVASARARTARGTAGCRATSAEQSRSWRSAVSETEPCSPPVCAGPRSAADTAVLSGYWR